MAKRLRINDLNKSIDFFFTSNTRFFGNLVNGGIWTTGPRTVKQGDWVTMKGFVYKNKHKLKNVGSKHLIYDLEYSMNL